VDISDTFLFGNIFGNKYAYVAAGEEGLIIVDITNPRNPKRLSSLDVGSFSVSVFVMNNYAYIADRDTGILIVDITDPKHPKLVKHLHEIGGALDVHVLVSD